MPKVVLKSCYGGYKLSKAALDYLGISREEAYIFEDDPTNPKLVECVEKLGDAANTTYEKLRVVEIPDGIEWTITQHYGIEQVEEVHRVWG